MERAHVPTRQQVLSLPSLTTDQKQQVETIYQQARQTMEPLMEQMRAMKQQGGNNMPNGGGAPNPQMMDLMHQIRQQRMNTWQAVQAKLTPAQVSQLQQQ
jgi:Spy/CpxP family protein refolding chaperone